MDNVFLVGLSLVVTVLASLAAIYLARYVMSSFDKMVGIDLPAIVNGKIADDAMASALYLGMRFFGLCVLIGLAVSR